MKVNFNQSVQNRLDIGTVSKFNEFELRLKSAKKTISIEHQLGFPVVILFNET